MTNAAPFDDASSMTAHRHGAEPKPRRPVVYSLPLQHIKHILSQIGASAGLTFGQQGNIIVWVGMKAYQVTIPYTEPEYAGADKRFYANIEIDANSEDEAVRRAVGEFSQLAALSNIHWQRNIIRGEIKVESVAESPKVKLDIGVLPLEGNMVCLRLNGALDSSTVDLFNEELEHDAKRGAKVFVFDLSRLTYINSTALGLLVGISDLVEVRLANLPPKIRRIMAMIGLDKVFKVYPTVEDASKH